MNSSNAGNHQWSTRDAINQLVNQLPPLPAPPASLRRSSSVNHAAVDVSTACMPPQPQFTQANAGRMAELLNQLRMATSTISSSPIAILQSSLERIQFLQQRCSQLELENSKALDAFQKLVAVEQEAESNRSMIASLLSTGSTSPAVKPLSERDRISRHSTPHSRSANHSVSLLNQSNTHSRQSSITSNQDDLMSDYSNDISDSISPPNNRTSLNSAAPTAATTPALATISTNGSIIGCSQSFAELFGFSYLFSRSTAGLYNLFTLVPENASQIRQAIDQALENPPAQAIINVQWWLKNCTVIMTLSPLPISSNVLPDTAGVNTDGSACLSATFRVIQMSAVNTTAAPAESFSAANRRRHSSRQDQTTASINQMFGLPE